MRQRRKGFAVLLVLMTVALTAVLAAGAMQMARQSVAMSQALQLQTEGAVAADAGIRLAATRLVVEPIPYRALQQRQMRWHGWTVAVDIEDEGGKIDINRGSPALLQAAIATFPGASGRLAQILAQQTGRRFVSVDELAGVLGLNGFDTIRLRRWLTVHGDEILDRTAAAPELRQLLNARAVQGSIVEGGGGEGRSRLETYTISAVAERDGYKVRRASIVRLTPGFADPFEWLEQASSVPPAR